MNMKKLLCFFLLSAFSASGLYSQSTPTSIKVGDKYQGGIVAYLFQEGDTGYDKNKQHGLIAAKKDQSAEALWGCARKLVPLAEGTVIGTGAKNTAAIVASCPTLGIAARVAQNYDGGGFNDWYLPSKDELNKLYLNKTAVGGFDNGMPNSYWSSSVSKVGPPWYQGFDDGFSDNFGHGTETRRVRAVRTF